MTPIRPIAVLLAVALLVTVAVVAITSAPHGQAPQSADLGVGQPVPNIVGTTLDGAAFDLVALRGKPVVINFWKPTCVPCREEFPFLAAKATEHAAAGLVIVGVMSDDPVELARAFAAQYGSSWSSVIDQGGAIKAAWRVIAWPQTYFVDATGVLRSIQIGEVTETVFERQYAAISGGG
ncbi:MAG: cytochrome c biosis protein CcmG, thiol:disulfide interchange protein DsbE [Chloroflexota bacterium]|jgi:thiol-disulfide isomerase/thioredoxin|nr:cytochrome c biosis protein CcmG, thiol:disulfide interchange protein DsbE [Chloroflexota bacterium]